MTGREMQGECSMQLRFVRHVNEAATHYRQRLSRVAEALPLRSVVYLPTASGTTDTRAAHRETWSPRQNEEMAGRQMIYCSRWCGREQDV